MADHEKTYTIEGHRHVRKSFLFSIEDDSSSSDSGEEIIPNTPKQTNGSVQASCTTPPPTIKSVIKHLMYTFFLSGPICLKKRFLKVNLYIYCDFMTFEYFCSSIKEDIQCKIKRLLNSENVIKIRKIEKKRSLK